MISRVVQSSEQCYQGVELNLEDLSGLRRIEKGRKGFVKEDRDGGTPAMIKEWECGSSAEPN
jgi:hypothetical protein